MDNAFVRAIVCIGEKSTPFGIWRLVGFDGEAVILRRDEATTSTFVNARLIDTAITVLHFERRKAGRQSKQLMSEADAKNGFRAG